MAEADGVITGRPVTLRDVAAAAGVDPSTVSKILNGDSILVRDETRDRVLAQVKALGYRPNANARGLRLQRSGSYGLLVPDLTNPVYASIARGAVRRATERGVSLMLAEITGEAGGESYRLLVQEKRIDGLLVATARDSDSMMADLHRDGVPHVFVNRRMSGAPSITVDDEAGSALAARTMIEHGHRRLAAITGPDDIDTARRRRTGFLDEVARHGLDAPVTATGEFTASGGYQAMTELLQGAEPPTAVFVSNFVAALGALRAIADLGLRCPDDVSVISFDDAEIADYTTPSLSSVRMPFEELGERAVEMLAGRVEGKDLPDASVTTPPLLRLRESLARL